MSKFLILLGLCVMLVLSSPLPSESQRRFLFVPWLGADITVPIGFNAHPPGARVVLNLNSIPNSEFEFCFSEMIEAQECRTVLFSDVEAARPGVPAGMQLCFLDETDGPVASVEFADVNGDMQNEQVIRFNPGSTIMQLRMVGTRKRILAAYRVVAYMPTTGMCTPVIEVEDCSGKCFTRREIELKLRDGVCNDSTQDINLDCEEFAFDAGDCLPTVLTDAGRCYP